MSIKRKGFCIFGVFGVALWLPIRAAQEVMNRYDYWVQFKAGSSITFRCRTTSGGTTRELLKVFSVKKVTPQSVIVEYHEAAVPGAAPAAAKSTGLFAWTMEFPAYENPAADVDFFGSQLNVNPFRAWENEDAAEVEKGVEDLTIQGAKIRASRTRVRFGSPSLRTTITLWRNDAVPGTIVKFRRILEGEASLEEEVSATEFKSFKAEPAEISRLRAEHKPETVVETGLEFFDAHFRFAKDLESCQKNLNSFMEAFGRLLANSPERDWAAASKAWERYKAASQGLKDHYSEDRKRVEAILKPTEFIKLGPILKQATELADIYTRFPDVLLNLSSFIANPPPPEQIKSLAEELSAFNAAFQAAYQRTQAEFLKLGSIRIESIR